MSDQHLWLETVLPSSICSKVTCFIPSTELVASKWSQRGEGPGRSAWTKTPNYPQIMISPFSPNCAPNLLVLLLFMAYNIVILKCSILVYLKGPVWVF